MRRFSFRKGLRFMRQARAWDVVRRLTDRSIQLEAEDGELWTVKEGEILEMCGECTLTVDVESLRHQSALPVTRDLSTFKEEIQIRARRRESYLRRLQEQGALVFTKELTGRIRQVATSLGDPKPPSVASVYRWWRRYQGGRSLTSLADRWESRGRVRRWKPEVQKVVDEAINTIFLNTQKNPGKTVCELVEKHVGELNEDLAPTEQLRLPSPATLYRYMRCFEAYDIAVARDGKAAANQKFRSVVGVQKTDRILERVEIDHTPINLLAFCDISLLPIGRPWLTLAIDKHSRMVVGFYIGFHTPSAYSVLQCLKQAILPKDELLRRYPDITTPWPARGIPEVVVCDNGMDLHSSALAMTCQEMGIQLQFCPAKTPQYKGAVERFMRTINHSLIHMLPGTVFSKPVERGDYPAEELAAISFDTLVHLVTKWIVEIYAQENHRGLAS